MAVRMSVAIDFSPSNAPPIRSRFFPAKVCSSVNAALVSPLSKSPRILMPLTRVFHASLTPSITAPATALNPSIAPVTTSIPTLHATFAASIANTAANLRPSKAIRPTALTAGKTTAATALRAFIANLSSSIANLTAMGKMNLPTSIRTKPIALPTKPIVVATLANPVTSPEINPLPTNKANLPNSIIRNRMPLPIGARPVAIF